ncbi:MAG: carboxypeptidase regulatory-like domain-containing protein, partial [Clostridia bacterium]
VNITLPSGEVLTIDYGAKLDKPTSPQKDGYFFAGWYTDEGCSKQLIFDGNATKDGIVCDMTLYAKWEQEVFNVSGKIVDIDGNPISGVTITVDASPTKYVVCTDDNGVYNIDGVANGTYRLIASYQKGAKQTSITEVIKIDGANVVVADIKLRGDGLNSTVEVGSDAPDAVVGGLNNIFEGDKFISTAEKDTAKKDGNKIEIKFVINKIEMEQKFVDYANQNKKDVALHLDLSLFKILTVDGKEFTSYLSSVDTLLQVIIPLSSELQGKKNYVIYRLHNEEMQEIKMGATNKNEAGEYLEMSNDGKSIILFTKNFSDYAIAFDQPFDYIWVIVDSVLGAILLLAILFAVFKNRKNKDDKKDNNKNGTDNNGGETAENQNLDSQENGNNDNSKIAQNQNFDHQNTNSKNNSQNAENGVESVKSKHSTPSSVKLNSFVLPSVFLAAIT